MARDDDSNTFVMGTEADEGDQVPAPLLPPVTGQEHLIARRYREMGFINGGGMGEIKRVWDTRMGRSSAMKIIRPEKAGLARAVERFVREARTTGRLQHPGIVAVHDMGQLPDGRWWFTMQEVVGRTLEDLMADVHAESSPRGWRPGKSGHTFRRLVDALLRVCQAVAYAHVEGYIHRDLKPENVMIGRFGEVVVLDWGLGKLVASMVEDFEPVDDTLDDGASSSATRAGGVLGSPPYMAPEQARGEVASVGPPADVYALGATLYHLLAGVPPYRGRSARDIVERVKAAPPPPVVRAAHGRCPEPDEELARICERAMAREPGDRYAHAGELARALEDWLDGTRRAEEARGEVASAETLVREIESWRQRSLELRREAAQLAARLPVRPTELDQVPVWSLEDEADSLAMRVRQGEAQVEARLMSAMALAPRLTQAHDLLADQYKIRLDRAERLGEVNEATRWETLLRANDRGRYRAWLDSGGRLFLDTAPSGAEVALYRMVERERRLVPVRVGVLGETPIEGEELPRGRIMLELRREGCALARLPLLVHRGETIQLAPPGAGHRLPLPLLARDSISSREVYVPGGWAIVGGDPVALDSLPFARVWIDGFVMSRFHVTVAEYREYLSDLAAQGRWAEIDRFGPTTTQLAGADPLWRRVGPTAVELVPPPTSPDSFARADMPMTWLSWEGAAAYVRWRAHRDGLPWRMPHELEWEKAGRGVEGRTWPWGDWTVPGRACIGDAHQGTPRPQPVGSHVGDVSVYGVRDLAGNLRCWCGNPYRAPLPGDGERLVVDALSWLKPAPHRVVRGGTYTSQPHTARLASRYGAPQDQSYPSTGIRLVRPVE